MEEYIAFGDDLSLPSMRYGCHSKSDPETESHVSPVIQVSCVVWQRMGPVMYSAIRSTFNTKPEM